MPQCACPKPAVKGAFQGWLFDEFSLTGAMIVEEINALCNFLLCYNKKLLLKFFML